MGWAQKNGNKWTPAYRVEGQKRTCGPQSCGVSFGANEKKQAEAHANECEAKALALLKAERDWRERNPDPKGRLSPSQKAAITIEGFWVRYQKYSKIEPKTLEAYDCNMRLRVLDLAPAKGEKPEQRFRHLRPDDLTREDIDIWLVDMEHAGHNPATIRSTVMTFSSVLSLARKHGVLTHDNPLHGVEVIVPKPVRKPDEMVLPDWAYERLLAELPTRGLRLLTVALAATGGRYEEGSAFHVEDVNPLRDVQHVRRRVTKTKPNQVRGHQGGVVVYENTKNKTIREFAVESWYTQLIAAWVAENGLQHGDPLFGRDVVRPLGNDRISDTERPVLTEDYIASLGRTEPNRWGKSYRHGTLAGYCAGQCRCEDCAYARRLHERNRRVKRGQRVASRPSASPYLPYHTYLYHFNKAVAKLGLEAELGWKPTPHCLRHTNITNMAENGVDIFTMQSRSGHRDINVLQGYIHRKTEADRRAAAAASKPVDPKLLAAVAS